MKHAIICGAGKMGTAIGHAMKHLGYDISIVESDHGNVHKFFKTNKECKTYSHWSQINDQVDVFISALPYHATLDAAVWCIDNGIRYCDLGGSVPVSQQIKEVTERDAKAPVMTDLGLAPGWANIAAEEIYRLMPDADTITMMVGGIPVTPHEFDPLKYKITWSMDGLINEYLDDCVILDYGHHQKMVGMSDLESVNIDGRELEAFNTSGAISHTIDVMARRGVKNCSYKTLRWPGHHKLITYLLKAFAKNRAALEELLNYSSSYYKDDMVILNVVAKSGHASIAKNLTIYPKGDFSAMQRATAFPIASVAHQMAQGKFDHLRYPVYSDVDLESFNQDLSRLLD